MTVCRRLVALGALAATLAACTDATAPRAAAMEGEWLFTENLILGPEDGCFGSGSYILTGSSATAFGGVVAPRIGGSCLFKPYGTAVLNGVVAGNTITFTAGPCSHTGAFASAARDSVSGTFTCTAPAPAGTGTWQAVRAGAPTTMTLDLAAATVVVGGAVRVTATFRDAAGRQLAARTISWDTNIANALIAGAAPDPTPGASSAVITGFSPGTAAFVARGHVVDAAGLDNLMNASFLLTVQTVSFAAVAAGTGETCALTPSGQAWCWGNSFGSGTPVPRFPGATFASLSSSGLHTCGVQSNGGVQCSGIGAHGNTGVVSGSLSFASVSVGANHTCGVAVTGAAYCWGDNTAGQLGNGATLPQALPVAVSGGLVFSAVSAGGISHSCGLTPLGAVWCWGRNADGELGNGSTTGTTTPVQVSGGLTFTSISVRYYGTCGVATGGAAYCWGRNMEGQLGIGSTDINPHPLPEPVAGGLAFTALSATFGSACGVTTAHAAWCWGTGSLGSATASSTTPVAVAGGLTFDSVSVGDFHSCGMTTGGVAYCWGGNPYGALGDGTTTASAVPVKVKGQP